MNTAYFLTGHGERGANGYYSVLADRQFIDLRRVWRPVDIDLVMKEMLVRRRPLAAKLALRIPPREPRIAIASRPSGSTRDGSSSRRSR
jgi:hypothetical protein